MTIKKRLFWSNLLMILVPVIATAVIGLICAAFIWLAVVGGTGFGIHDQEEFDLAASVISEAVEKSLTKDTGFSDIEALLDSNQMKMVITDGTNPVYTHGSADGRDEALVQAADTLKGDATLTQDGRAMDLRRVTIKGHTYTIYQSGNYQSVGSYANLKSFAVFAVVLIALTIFLSVLFTNRYLTKYVLRRIEGSLAILATGVQELKDGRLDYRITDTSQDEFTPVCENFNAMAEQLKESVETIKQQERSRKELIAGISHDIRSPLTSIQAYVEGLIDGVAKTPEKQQQYLQMIKNKSEELAHIISQLFLFSKMELGEYPEHPCVIELDVAVRETVAGLEDEYRDKGLVITTALETAVITADPVQITRIISNILGNSLKYKVRDKGYVRISLEKKAQGCRLSFSDDGPGVSPEALPHLFEVFYRDDPSRQYPGKGSGLGLAIVASAVRRMAGNISAQNGENGGLEVSIDFPGTQRVKEGEKKG